MFLSAFEGWFFGVPALQKGARVFLFCVCLSENMNGTPKISWFIIRPNIIYCWLTFIPTEFPQYSQVMSELLFFLLSHTLVYPTVKATMNVDHIPRVFHSFPHGFVCLPQGFFASRSSQFQIPSGYD